MKSIKYVLFLLLMFCGMSTVLFAGPPMYAGVDMGYGVSFPDFGGNFSPIADGFEITPHFGISPINKVPDLSFEFDLQMDFLKYYSAFGDFNYSVITPQLFAVYTYSKWFVKPFIGIGMGVNIINLDSYSEQVGTKASFSFAVKGGAKVVIPRTDIFVSLLAKYNVNMLDVDGLSQTVNMGSVSVDLGLGYNF